jgi:predicted nucleic acid-binding Zn ribbon protein
MTEPPPSNIEILGSWLTGTSHTKESGGNRALIFIAQEESVSGDPSLTSVTYGGQAMTKVIERSAVAMNGYGNYVTAFILDEAGVAAATSGNFSISWSATTSSVSYASVFLSNVDQTTMTGASASNSTTSSTPNPITTSALATNNEDMVILGAVCGNNGSYTLNNGFTEGTDQSVGTNGHTGVTGHKSATGASETPSATYNTGPNRQAIIGFVVQAGGGGGIPGDLNDDMKVDFIDFAILGEGWLTTYDMDTLADIADYWLYGT